MSTYINEENCDRMGHDPQKVSRLANRLKKIADDCSKEGIMIFAGCYGGLQLRPKAEPFADNNLAQGISYNCDGGDGGD